MKSKLSLTVGAMVVLAFASGCGGSDTNSGGAAGASSAGASSTSGGASSTSGGASSSSGGASSTSGGASSSSGGFTTSVPASTPLNGLTPDQVTQICSDVQKFASGSLDSALSGYECASLAVVAAATATTDAEAEASCKASLADCTPNDTSGGTCSAPPATCTATVGEATACFNDLVGALKTAQAAVPSCDGLTVAKATAALAGLASNGGLTTPASCTKYETDCPDSTMLPPGM